MQSLAMFITVAGTLAVPVAIFLYFGVLLLAFLVQVVVLPLADAKVEIRTWDCDEYCEYYAKL